MMTSVVRSSWDVETTYDPEDVHVYAISWYEAWAKDDQSRT